MTTNPTTDSSGLSGGSLSAAISNELVRLHRQHFGRGPTQTRTLVVEEMVVCRMTDPFTPAERTLIGLGRMDEVRVARRAIREGLATEFAGVIEGLVDRPVVAWAFDLHLDPDIAVEAFLF